MNNLQIQSDSEPAFEHVIGAAPASEAETASSGEVAEPLAPAIANAHQGQDFPARTLGIGEIAFVVVASIAAHVGVAQALPRSGHDVPVRVPSKVEIAFVRPATPVVVPPQVEKPTPPRPRPKRLAAPTPPPPQEEQPPAETPEPVVEEAPAPPGPEGTVVAAPSEVVGTGTRGDAPVAPPPAPPPVVAAHEGANYLQNPRPAYPALAMSRGWQGKVLLRVQVGPDGRPRAISVSQSSGRSLLDDAAVAAVRGWSFVPARQGGQPVAGWVSVPIVFQLS